MRRALVVLAAMAWSASASAQPVQFTFGGETYVSGFDAPTDGQRMVEFTRPGETVDDWSTLLALRHYRDLPGTPQQAVDELARTVLANYPAADVSTGGGGAPGEASISFDAAAPNDDAVEVDVFKYAVAGDQNGLVSIQFAFRFKRGSLGPDALAAARARAVREVRAFDMDAVRTFFAKR